jgi:hypothetical protein
MAQEFIRTKTIGDMLAELPAPKDIIAVDESATVEQVYAVLFQNDIISLPICKTASSGQRSYEAIIDTFGTFVLVMMGLCVQK